MAGTENSDRTRHWLAEQIRREQVDRAEKLQALQRELQALAVNRAELAQQLTRALEFDPGSGLCPRCAILRGVTSHLEPVPMAAVGGEPDPGPGIKTCAACMWDDSVTM